MADRAKQTRLRRPKKPASSRGRSRLSDITRPVPREARITEKGRSTFFVTVIAVIVVGAVVASLVGLPLQTYLGQGDEIDRLTEQVERLEEVNADLAAEVDRLRTDEGIIEAARSELGYVIDGERRETLLDLPDLPEDLPSGWPYGPVGDILAVRLATP